MSINMFLEQSHQQATSVNDLCQNQLTAYQAIQKAIEGFVQDTSSLKGEAYTAARNYFANVLLPLSQGGELYAQVLSQIIFKLPNEYIERVDSKSWTEDELLRAIEQENRQIAQIEMSNTLLINATLPNAIKQDLRYNNLELLRGHQANKRTYETILNDLRSYHQYSAGLFDELADIETLMTKGLKALSTSSDKNSHFQSLTDNTWARELTSRFETRALAMTKKDKF
ncbi:T7SS effector LXG polymorphic toxin [Streptococcus pacificus]|uniref:Virulence protein n=1 Tax=Streptococcus pacificus TaxID=2740577 RepID=A0ABS0ZJG9_9STRE|nr:T7SS effector LXG polymorphic toxin [Streptococcus pacificus]MBJ8326121.1 virulence protein [Streptococcus pacificus]